MKNVNRSWGTVQRLASGRWGWRSFVAALYTNRHDGQWWWWWRLFHSLCQDQSTVAQRAEMTLAKCSLTSCTWARFQWGSHTMLRQWYSRPMTCAVSKHLPWVLEHMLSTSGRWNRFKGSTGAVSENLGQSAYWLFPVCLSVLEVNWAELNWMHAEKISFSKFGIKSHGHFKAKSLRWGLFWCHLSVG